jgi:hypothetical protein
MEYVSFILSILSIILFIICVQEIVENWKEHCELSNKRKDDRQDLDLLLDHLKLRVDDDKRIIKK